MELDTLRWVRRAQHMNHNGIQPLQGQEYKLGDILPAAAQIFHHKKEGPNLPIDSILQESCQAAKTVESGRRQDHSIYGPQ
jgi:hypothetical protein